MYDLDLVWFDMCFWSNFNMSFEEFLELDLKTIYKFVERFNENKKIEAKNKKRKR